MKNTRCCNPHKRRETIRLVSRDMYVKNVGFCKSTPLPFSRSTPMQKDFCTLATLMDLLSRLELSIVWLFHPCGASTLQGEPVES